VKILMGSLGLLLGWLLAPSALGIAPWLAKKVVRRRARRLPSPYCERYEVEWTAEIEAMGENAGIGALIFAVVSGFRAKEMATIADQAATDATQDDRLQLPHNAENVARVLERGFRGPTVCRLVGISYRQLDYWARTGLVTPSVQAADGSGTHRLYGFTDLVELRIIKSLLDAQVSLQRIREAIRYLRREATVQPLTDAMLMSDGEHIYACHSGEEIIDVLDHGRAVFGIAIGRVWADTQGDIANLPDWG
jgi:DNA-binding transcriptional MerR regulator